MCTYVVIVIVEMYVVVVTWARGTCPRAAAPRVKGIYIRLITRAHVTSNMYHF